MSNRAIDDRLSGRSRTSCSDGDAFDLVEADLIGGAVVKDRWSVAGGQ
jgi:hypothetical protein